MPHRSLALLVLAGHLGAGCTEDLTHLTVRLQPDLARQSEVQLCRALVRIDLMVDAAAPGRALAGLPPDQGSGPVRYVDLDGDGAREALISYPWADAARLPVIDLTTTANRGQALMLRVEGYDAADALVALGGLSSVIPGEQPEVAVPLNLLPSQLPPRVVGTVPESGQVLELLEDFSVTFSRLLTPAAVTPETVYLDCRSPGGAALQHPSACHLTEEHFDHPSSSRHRVRCDIAVSSLEALGCAIVVTPLVTADDGSPLDQDATVPGPDGFRSEEFTIAATVVTAQTIDCRLPPTHPDYVECPGAAGLECDAATGGCQVADACGTCTTGMVCSGSSCQEDCRMLGACLDPGSVCDSTGRCSPP